jgi:hypothetical protein
MHREKKLEGFSSQMESFYFVLFWVKLFLFCEKIFQMQEFVLRVGFYFKAKEWRACMENGFKFFFDC